MKKALHESNRRFRIACHLGAIFTILTFSCTWVSGRLLDDFNDGLKTDWTDFTFVPGFGLPKEADGKFTFELPPAGQQIFSASQKTSETFDLKDGRTIEFRVDLVVGGGKDSFAVLAFIPTDNSAGTLAGYGLSKSTTDVLVSKGISKYFYNENPPEPLKNENVTLVLRLTGKNGAVVIRAQVLDKDASDAVIFERTFIDTNAAEVLADGEDSPAAPYLGSGYFTLYAFEDFDAGAPEDPYRVVFDNAEVTILDAVLIDNFDDNTKTDWTDFTFVPGFGLPKESNGRLTFELPPAGQQIFTASQKTSQVYELKNGEELEFQVDIVESGEKDSFAILSFTPIANSPGTLEGYGFAKSTTDILITKGISKYFYNEDPPEPIKNENITLTLAMSARNGSVTVTGRVLDKDAGDAVIFEKTIVDTPAADVLADGEDIPAAPFITSGYFTLFVFADFDPGAPEDPYRVIYDNAVVLVAPKTENAAPIIGSVQPAEFASFLPDSTEVSFAVTDDSVIPEAGLSITLNGEIFTTGNGLTVTDSGNGKKAAITGLAPNVNYSAIFNAEDSEGKTASRTIYFDTFAKNSFFIEIEDYNFEGGKYIAQPVPDFEGGFSANSYSLQIGFLDIDFTETRGTPNGEDTMYRTDDSIRMQHTRDFLRDKYVALGGPDNGIYDYDVGDIVQGEWLNYTRNFIAGTYDVYLRQAIVNMASGESALELVTGDRSKPGQSTRLLGSFLGERTGFQYRNFPLTDGSGQNRVVLRLNGETTLRLRQVTSNAADGGRFQNYLIFIPVADPGLQRAAITSVFPAPDSTVSTVTPVVQALIQNRDTRVKPETLIFTLNGQAVMPVLSSAGDETTIRYEFAELPESGARTTARISFKDTDDTEISVEWTFAVSYKRLDPANRLTATGLDRGFEIRVVQAPIEAGPLENTLDRAENQLKANSTIPKAVDQAATADVINFNKRFGENAGSFAADQMVPGIDPNLTGNGDNDFAVEIQGYLEIPAGVHRFGVISDDGYKIVASKVFSDLSAPALAFHNGGPANETFDFVVSTGGVYPFRMVWYERGGAGYAEWFSENVETGERILINDSANPAAIKAYRTIEVLPSIVLESSERIGGGFQEIGGAAVNPVALTVTIPISGSQAFYRLRAATALRITKTELINGSLVLHYQ